MLLLTEMRTQELLALEMEHIEPDGSCIHIRQAVKQVKGTAFIGTPRSESSVRDVPVCAAYRDMVKSLRSECQPFLWTGKGPATRPTSESITGWQWPKCQVFAA